MNSPYPNIEQKTGWTNHQKADPIATMRREIVAVLGEFETEKRTLFEKIEDVHLELVRERRICPLGGCAGSMGCACPC